MKNVAMMKMRGSENGTQSFADIDRRQFFYYVGLNEDQKSKVRHVKLLLPIN